jgi:hypothetical protein
VQKFSFQQLPFSTTLQAPSQNCPQLVNPLPVGMTRLAIVGSVHGLVKIIEEKRHIGGMGVMAGSTGKFTPWPIGVIGQPVGMPFARIT